jgi:hypothetical protein
MVRWKVPLVKGRRNWAAVAEMEGNIPEEPVKEMVGAGEATRRNLKR